MSNNHYRFIISLFYYRCNVVTKRSHTVTPERTGHVNRAYWHRGHVENKDNSTDLSVLSVQCYLT